MKLYDPWIFGPLRVFPIKPFSLKDVLGEDLTLRPEG